MTQPEHGQLKSYYDKKFARLSDNTQRALRNIELECETLRERLDARQQTITDHTHK